MEPDSRLRHVRQKTVDGIVLVNLHLDDGAGLDATQRTAALAILDAGNLVPVIHYDKIPNHDMFSLSHGAIPPGIFRAPHMLRPLTGTQSPSR